MEFAAALGDALSSVAGMTMTAVEPFQKLDRRLFAGLAAEAVSLMRYLLDANVIIGLLNEQLRNWGGECDGKIAISAIPGLRLTDWHG